jgi:hypothetical protein
MGPSRHRTKALAGYTIRHCNLEPCPHKRELDDHTRGHHRLAADRRYTKARDVRKIRRTGSDHRRAIRCLVKACRKIPRVRRRHSAPQSASKNWKEAVAHFAKTFVALANSSVRRCLGDRS